MYTKYIFFWISGFATLMIVYTSYWASIHKDNFEQNVLRLQVKTKFILLWNPWLNSSLDYGFGIGDEPFKQHKCEYTNCYITHNKSYKSSSEYDAIVFHAPLLHHFPAISNRTYHQRYVFLSRESPVNFRTYQDYDDLFNWTITYREDSDIYVPYGEIKRREKRVKRENKNFTKQNLVAWMVSHCKTHGHREDYIEELRKYIQVDIYGRCGNNKCPKENWKQCYDMIQNNYKFYLSFENSLCKDYVTEKVFNILHYDVIPVVYGSADYNRILPPNSYINALDYSPSELANLLRDIADDLIKYQRYFKWKEEYELHAYDFSFFVKHAFCELCKKLHTDTETKFYRNFNKWWRDGSNCTNTPIIQSAPALHF
ncbi:alpha-(1,3)-fucosyltransferase C-like [Artemia franciscana]|uniref:Fucosyltransferase n=1 Tax=Artemia franciscana TaxID=6661 RepID=A0AA88H4I5_ARTSF|nr:hypothetical protein QYM36_020032 [Artemia franciscana]